MRYWRPTANFSGRRRRGRRQSSPAVTAQGSLRPTRVSRRTTSTRDRHSCCGITKPCAGGGGRRRWWRTGMSSRDYGARKRHPLVLAGVPQGTSIRAPRSPRLHSGGRRTVSRTCSTKLRRSARRREPDSGITNWTFAGDGKLDTAPIVRRGPRLRRVLRREPLRARCDDRARRPGRRTWDGDLDGQRAVLAAANGTLVVSAGTQLLAYRSDGDDHRRAGERVAADDRGPADLSGGEP